MPSANTDDLARHRAGRTVAYSVLAELWARGLTSRVRTHVSAVPGLMAHATASHDELAVRHQRVLRHEVFPHEGVFLRSDGLAGEGDHVAHQLERLARARGDEQVSRLLGHHLLRWLPALVIAVREEGDPLFSELATWTLQVVEDQALEVGATAAPLPTCAPPPDLDATDTSLGDVVEYLLTPVRCGLFVSRSAIGRAGRASGAPRGFGPRRTMLTNLLRSAAAYDGLHEVTVTLRAMIERAQLAHKARPQGQAWVERLSHSDALLRRFRTSGAA